MTIPNDYVERVYAGWLAKVIGVRHGGNIENWTYDRIERTFGEITEYLHEFKILQRTMIRTVRCFPASARGLRMWNRDYCGANGADLAELRAGRPRLYWWGGYGNQPSIPPTLI